MTLETSVELQTVTADPADLTGYIAALTQVLDGAASFLPLPPATTPAQAQANEDLSASMRVGSSIAAGTLIACTSGSTGTPKGAMLSADNLRSSGEATAAYLRAKYGVEPGAWLLTLPPHHIAGSQVILRSLAAGCTPLVASHLAACSAPTSGLSSAPSSGPSQSHSFTVKGFVSDTQRLREAFPDRDLYTSLVPAQLERLASEASGVEAMRAYSTILIGGAAARGEIIATIEELGIRYALTYGSSETSGGAVYDGHPLPGVTLDVEPLNADESQSSTHNPTLSAVPASLRGRVIISGPMVSRGYRNVPDSPAFPQAGTYVTSDLGELAPLPSSSLSSPSPSRPFITDATPAPTGSSTMTLRILGRADGAINTGGYKVLPEDVERAIQAQVPTLTLSSGDTVSTATLCVTGVDDDTFGQVVAVAIEGGVGKEEGDGKEDGNAQATDITTEVRDALRGRVAKHLIPQRAVLVQKLPTSGPGKINRRGVAKLFHDDAAKPRQD